jgi:hypothetical protein
MLRSLALSLLVLALPVAVRADEAADPKPAADAAKSDPDLADLIAKLKDAKPGKRGDTIAKDLVGKECSLNGTITAYKQLDYHKNGAKAQDSVIVLKVGHEEVYLKPEDDIDPKKLPYPVHFVLTGTCRVIGASDDTRVMIEPVGRLAARAAH